MTKLTRQDQKEYQEWLELCERIRNQTNEIPDETTSQQRKRIARLTDNFTEFCRFYLSHYMDAKFGWFHNKAAKDIKDDPNFFGVLEWPREHAKSVFIDVLMPLFLKARGELDGVLLGSSTEKKANGLLGDLQADLISNQKFIHDYGDQATIGNWQSGYFSTTDGLGFWAYGRGQSPRGARKAAKRPNLGIIDDIDDKDLVKNEERVNEVFDWIIEDFYGGLSILGGRFMMAGNRIHKKSVLAKMVGDIEPGDPKNQGIYHLKVYAFETHKHTKADSDTGKPAWKERYTKERLLKKMAPMTYRAVRREYFHEHIEDGIIFKNQWIQWAKPLPLKSYNSLILYADPSFKDTKHSDYKALVLAGTNGKRIDVLWAWVRQASVMAMVQAFYDQYEEYENYAKYYIEANMLQDLLLDEFEQEGDNRGYQMPIRPDRRQKPDKVTRIENISPLFERGFVRFNENERKNPDMQTLIQQILGFGGGAHDDGPDALEGAISLLQKKGRGKQLQPRAGKYRKNQRRTAQ